MQGCNGHTRARVLVTGVTGQVGWYVADQLHRQGHEVLGVGWPSDAPFPPHTVRCSVDLLPETVAQVLDACGELDAVIHLAGVSSVMESWRNPMQAFDVNARLTAALVYAVAQQRTLRLVHASSAEIFGDSGQGVQSEQTPLAPLSPYGVSKAAGHLVVRLGRVAFGAPMSNIIFYLGESERRPPVFVFRKITRGVAAVHLGLQECVTLGNTAIVRDFSHARDFASAAVLLALHAPPDDYICASGVGHSIQDVAVVACRVLGLDPARVLRTDPTLFRKTDIPSLVGDSRRLQAAGWSPSMSFDQLVESLVRHDLAELRSRPPNPPGGAM